MRSRKDITRALEESKYHELSILLPDKRKLIALLVSLTYDRKNVVAWRAIEAIGLVTARLAEEDPGLVRNVVGRLLWMIRDESGGIGWSVPEILGEIVRNNPVLCADIAPIIASFHDEKMLAAGVMRAIARTGEIDTGFRDYAVSVVTAHLDAPDGPTRAHAAYAAGELRMTAAAAILGKLLNDRAPVLFYYGGELKETTVGRIAAKALARLQPDA